MQKGKEKNNTNNIELLKDIKVAYHHIEKMLGNIDYDNFKYSLVLNSIKSELKDLYNDTYKNMQNSEHEKEKLITSACCKKCENNLFISDNIDYSYQCNECDENFYDFEVVSDDIWYNREEKVIKEIPSSFEIELVYDKDEEMVYIGTENSSGLKYDCKNTKDLSNIMETYCDNLMLDLEEMEREI